ncbi:MAG TPA: outer membrane protein assembly factor BamD [Polyangiaceae bacterium]|jgi:hypothetical protein|nr:outer membrane protein assembly factor BamD [Polyangiaceae bacterium]
MSDLKLVAPDQPTPLEQLLMDSARNESPSVEQRMRVRAALGLTALTAPPPPVVRTGRIGTLGKVAIGGAVGASVIAALVFALHKPAPRILPVVLSAPVATTPAAAPTTPAEAAQASEPVISPLPPVEAAPASAAAGTPKLTPKGVSSVSKSPAPADSADDLSEQLRLIDAARSAVASGNPSAASQALSSYSSKFPHGSFGQEAQVLRIETVDMQGNHAQAAELAKSFLERHPNSPHVSLVQRIAGGAQ